VASYGVSAVVSSGQIPAKFVTENDLLVLAACGFEYETYKRENEEKGYYFFAEEGMRSAIGLPEEIEGDYSDEDQWIAVFQDILGRSRKANQPIGHIDINASLSCSKMRPDGWGGFALFIEEDDVKETNTAGWLMEQANERKNRRKECAVCETMNPLSQNFCAECGADMYPEKGK